MSGNITDLEPKSLWYFFNEICKIPRPSKQEGRMADYLVNFAESRRLAYKTDHLKNVLIKKEASKGFENVTPVVLQSHQDMVGEKNQDTAHDFARDAIEPRVDGDWVKANNTTLGADDGIGIAAQLAILDAKDIAHGSIECLFTVDEETGLTGAFGLSPDFFESRTLINLDSEDWGEIFIGCAGGRDTKATFNRKTMSPPASCKPLKITLTGLQGGHSGDEIQKGLGNSIKLLNRLLLEAKDKFEIYLSSMEGGNARNAIPREATAEVYFSENQIKQFNTFIKDFEKTVRNELCVTAPDLKIDCNETPDTGSVLDGDIEKKLLMALSVCPHGEQAWSQTLEGLVETSTNLATIKFEDDLIEVGTSQRSSVQSKLNVMVRRVQNSFLLAGAKVESTDGYPGWEPNPDSKILKVAAGVYEELFGTKPIVRAIHAGLECGLIGEKYPCMDMVSIGPTIKGAHTPEERLHIESTIEFWNLLLEMLKRA